MLEGLLLSSLVGKELPTLSSCSVFIQIGPAAGDRWEGSEALGYFCMRERVPSIWRLEIEPVVGGS